MTRESLVSTTVWDWVSNGGEDPAGGFRYYAIPAGPRRQALVEEIARDRPCLLAEEIEEALEREHRAGRGHRDRWFAGNVEGQR